MKVDQQNAKTVAVLPIFNDFDISEIRGETRPKWRCQKLKVNRWRRLNNYF